MWVFLQDNALERSLRLWLFSCSYIYVIPTKIHQSFTRCLENNVKTTRHFVHSCICLDTRQCCVWHFLYLDTYEELKVSEVLCKQIWLSVQLHLPGIIKYIIIWYRNAKLAYLDKCTLQHLIWRTFFNVLIDIRCKLHFSCILVQIAN